MMTTFIVNDNITVVLLEMVLVTVGTVFAFGTYGMKAVEKVFGYC